MYSAIVLQAGDGGMGNFILIPAMLLVIYLFMIRPQMKRAKNEKKFQSEIKKGTKVVTTSGIHGKIVDLTDDAAIIETGAGKIKFERTAISMELSKKYVSPAETKK
ncbi:preprotein translocase subunit YajC [Aureibaculum marinum]|uniref:Sec translocon accessory complex subunit YajC n=1 Tax=Aureibaculum marinum TaxID=2487930 RepID=A0A3N4NX68_9FLAO|nr:preprotein translocase subunit YajC [Aureibaculum marinum]RPD98848.1 preprotein translocase subunit YajC [Aureibaculum marinum]